MQSALHSVPRVPVLPGYHEVTLDLKDGRQARTVIWLPEDYDPKSSSALVVALHDESGGSPFYGGKLLRELVVPGMAGMEPIVVAPDAAVGDWTSTQDVELLVSVVEQLRLAYRVDSRRIVLVGHSVGGTAVWAHAETPPVEFSAAVVVSAQPASEEPSLMPVYALHSRDDQVFRVGKTEQAVERSRGLGVDSRLVKLSGIEHGELRAFTPALEATGPWLQKIFDQAPASVASVACPEGRAASPDRVAVTTGYPQVRGQGDPDMLEIQMDEQLSGIRECYAQALSCTPDLRGEMSFKFAVKPNGRIQAAAPVGSTIRSPGLEECTRRSILAWSFPEHESGLVVVRVPVRFEGELP